MVTFDYMTNPEHASPRGAASPPSCRRAWSLIALLLLGALLVIGAVLRTQSFNRHFWLDEANQYWVARGVMPPADPNSGSILKVHQTARNIWEPPFFSYLLHLWMLISHKQLFLRLLPWLFGVATIPVMFLLARAVGGTAAGLTAATLVTFQPDLIYYSQELRPYSMEVFLVASMYAAALWWMNSRARASMIVLLTVAGAGVATRFEFSFFVVCVGITIIFFSARNYGILSRETIRWAVCFGLLALLAVLLWRQFGVKLQTTVAVQGAAALFDIRNRVATTAFLGKSVRELPYCLLPGPSNFGLFLLVLGTLGTFLLPRRSLERLGWLVFFALPTIIFFFLAGVHAYPFGGRYILILAPGWIYATAVGIGKLMETSLGLGSKPAVSFAWLGVLSAKWSRLYADFLLLRILLAAGFPIIAFLLLRRWKVVQRRAFGLQGVIFVSIIALSAYWLNKNTMRGHLHIPWPDPRPVVGYLEGTNNSSQRIVTCDSDFCVFWYYASERLQSRIYPHSLPCGSVAATREALAAIARSEKEFWIIWANRLPWVKEGIWADNFQEVLEGQAEVVSQVERGNYRITRVGRLP